MSEHAIQKACADFMASHDWKCLRTHFTAVIGHVSSLEPGIADYLFVRYMPSEHAPWRCILLWVEFKSPHDRRVCFCRQKAVKAAAERKRAQICSVCRQKNWRENERRRGAVVWLIDDFEEFAQTYWREFSWLHKDQAGAPMPAPRGQMSLLEE